MSTSRSVSCADLVVTSTHCGYHDCSHQAHYVEKLVSQSLSLQLDTCYVSFNFLTEILHTRSDHPRSTSFSQTLVQPPKQTPSLYSKSSSNPVACLCNLRILFSLKMCLLYPSPAGSTSAQSPRKSCPRRHASPPAPPGSERCCRRALRPPAAAHSAAPAPAPYRTAIANAGPARPDSAGAGPPAWRESPSRQPERSRKPAGLERTGGTRTRRHPSSGRGGRAGIPPPLPGRSGPMAKRADGGGRCHATPCALGQPPICYQLSTTW